MRVQETAPKYLTRKRKYTYQDYLALPPDDFRYQLIEGELVMTPAPSVVHQIVKRNLMKYLLRFVEENQLGLVLDAPCDVKLDEHNVVQPDIFYISHERKDVVTETIIQGAPDLVMEIISPTTGYMDMVDKKELYARFGVKEYWVVDPKWQWIEIYVREGERFRLHEQVERKGIANSQVLKGFQVELSHVFPQEPIGGEKAREK